MAEPHSIIRILAMIPIYSIISFFSLLFYQKGVYLELLRNCYEAYVIASFFTLMCHYVAPNLHEQKEYFRNVQPKPWVFPLEWIKPPRSRLTWFNIIYACVFQFCFTRPLFTIIAGITQTQGRYCPSSTRPENGHLWIVLLQGACVLAAMYCLIQFHMQLKEDLAPRKPFLKILSIKLVMFLVFWQTWLLGLLSMKDGPLRATLNMAVLDIHVAIPTMLVCFEMTIFACLHHWAFPWKPYDLDHQLRSPGRLDHYACAPHVALLHALNPWDYAKAAARGFKWLLYDARYRKEDSSYQITSTVDLETSAGKMRVSAPVEAKTSAFIDQASQSDIKKHDKLDEVRNRDRHTIG
jgi:hypothetical protein